MKTIAIVGSRGYPDLDAVREFVRNLPEGTRVVSGGALGVDRTAQDEARKRGLEVVVRLPNWKLHGKLAGLKRNQDIAMDCDEMVAFWTRCLKPLCRRPKPHMTHGTSNAIRWARDFGRVVIEVPA